MGQNENEEGANLRAITRNLRLAQRIARMGSWELDLTSRDLYWSDETYRIFGYEVGTPVTYGHFKVRVHPDDLEPFEQLNDLAIRGEIQLDIVHRIILEDGSMRWVREQGELEEMDAEGKLRFSGVVVDVTEQHLHEAFLKWEANSLHSIISGASLKELVDQMLGDTREFLPTKRSSVYVVHNEAVLMSCIGGECEEFARLATAVARARTSTVSIPWCHYLFEHEGAHFVLVVEPHYEHEPETVELRLLERFAQILEVGCQKISGEEELRESETVLSIASRVSKLGAWRVDLERRTYWWSDEVRRIHDLGPKDVLPKLESLLDFYHPSDRQRVEAAFVACMGSAEPFEIEVRFVSRLGTIKWVRTIAEARKNTQGQVVELYGAIQDITESKEYQEKLASSEEKFRILSNATNDAIWDWDLTTEAVWWNEGYVRLFGYTLEEGVASWTDHIHEDDRERVIESIFDAIEHKKDTWSEEYRYIHKNGTELIVSDRGFIIRDADGRALRMVGGMSDITRARRAQARLEELATLLDKAQDAIVVRDLDHRVQFWNKSAERLYGWSAEEVEGQRLDRLLFKDPTQFYQAVGETLKNGEWVGELEQETRDGATVTIEGHWSLVRKDDGTPKSILAINTDISERKRLEKKFLRAQRMETVGTLAGGVAHDLNNMLTPIMMSVTLLKEDEEDERRLRDLSNIEMSAARGAAMVRQLLTFARGADGGHMPVDLSLVAKDVQKIARDTFPKNIDFRLEGPENIWKVQADPTQLHQVLVNLCINARDAMPDGGVLSLSLTHIVLDEVYSDMNPEAAPGPYVHIVVEDTGTGMPPEVLDRMFEPFYTTKEVGQGTGLGLSTVHSIVLQHGGFIHVYSEVGKGTKFKVYLPAIASSADSEEVALAQTQLPRGRGELILVVDDEDTIRNVSERTLERFGYRVILAKNGAEAVSLYAQHRSEIALVITDMAMPVMDGPATIVALRSIDPDVKIVGSSGLDANGNVAKAVDAGVKDFVPKPYTAETLLTTIRRVLEG
jgi:PAS domain S-box-containing protein